MKNQRSSLIEVLNEISAENELAAAIATWEAEKKSRQQEDLEANCNGGRIRHLRGTRGRQQSKDGNGANCDDGDCERQRLGPQMNGDGDGMGHNGSGSLFGTGECDGEGCSQQRGDGQGRGHGGYRKGSNGLLAILRNISCEDGDIEDVADVLEAIDDLVKNNNQPAMRLDGALEAFVGECNESD